MLLSYKKKPNELVSAPGPSPYCLIRDLETFFASSV